MIRHGLVWAVISDSFGRALYDMHAEELSEEAAREALARMPPEVRRFRRVAAVYVLSVVFPNGEEMIMLRRLVRDPTGYSPLREQPGFDDPHRMPSSTETPPPRSDAAPAASNT